MNLDQFKINNRYLMLALDHRGSFKKLMNPEDGDRVEDFQAIDLKKQIIDSVKSQMSGVLIDPVLGLPAYDKSKPFLLPIEKSGYVEDGGGRISEIQYSVEQLKTYGASGAKLLIYFNPYNDTFSKQLETSKKVVEECKAADYPLFLEIVTYETDREISMEDRPKYVLDSLKAFINTGIIPDVFKLEYPGSMQACQQVTDLVGLTPWIILTRGVSFDEFVPQVTEASQSGCTGFLAGRALWQEVCTMQGEEKQKFLQETLPQRFKTIVDISQVSV